MSAIPLLVPVKPPAPELGLAVEESLHPHDAVAVITKGVPGGLLA